MIIALIFFLLISLGLGLSLIFLICPKCNLFVKIGLSYPLGVGIFTLLMFGSNLLGVKFSLLNESLLLLAICLPLSFFERKKIRGFFLSIFRNNRISDLDPIEKVILGVICFLVISSFINTLYWPVYMWDSVVLYDFRAHVFANTGFIRDAFIGGYYYSYPLLTSLAHTVVYLAGGAYPQFLYSVFYFSLGIGFYGLLREFISRKLSLFFTLILLLVEPIFYHSLFSYTNLTYMVYVGLGTILIYLWDRKALRSQKNHFGYLVLSGLLIGLSAWVRSVEPFWMAAILVVLIISIFRKRFWSPAAYFLTVIPFTQFWKLFQSSVAGGQVSVAGQADHYSKIWASLIDFTNWAKIFEYFYKHVFVSWGPIFILFIFAIISAFILKKIKDYFLIFFITLIFIAVLIGGIFIFSVNHDYWYRIGDATERLSMLFYPLFIYSIALVISGSTKHN